MYHEAMACGDKNEFVIAMTKEIAELEAWKTWNIVQRPANINVLPGTWAFKRKRYPGQIRKHKAHFCVHGDKQLPGIDYFDTYTPVVAWSMIRLMLTMTAVLDLHMKQVDYNNAFAQAPIAEDMYVELPKDFELNDGDSVLKLNTSLYGMKQSPLVWFEHLKAGLERQGFMASATDPCLFLGTDIICIRTEITKLRMSDGDSYDTNNLDWSESYLLNSITLELQNVITNKIADTEVSGPLLWMYIVQDVESNTTTAHQALLDELKHMTVKSFPGENVKQCTEKLSTICCQLSLADELPKNIGLLLCNVLTATMIDEFRLSFISIHGEFDLDH